MAPGLRVRVEFANVADVVVRFHVRLLGMREVLRRGRLAGDIVRDIILFLEWLLLLLSLLLLIQFPLLLLLLENMVG